MDSYEKSSSVRFSFCLNEKFGKAVTLVKKKHSDELKVSKGKNSKGNFDDKLEFVDSWRMTETPPPPPPPKKKKNLLLQRYGYFINIIFFVFVFKLSFVITGF